jgi:hypothetical protein
MQLIYAGLSPSNNPKSKSNLFNPKSPVSIDGHPMDQHRELLGN